MPSSPKGINLSKVINGLIILLIICAIILIVYNTKVSAILLGAAFILGFFKRQIIRALK